MSENFVDWLNGQLDERGWSRSEAARRGEFSASMLDKVIGGYAKPGLAFCNGISRAFDVDLEDVFRRAGILPDYGELPAEVRDWGRRLMRLSEGDRARAISMIEDLFAILEDKPQYRSPRSR